MYITEYHDSLFYFHWNAVEQIMSLDMQPQVLTSPKDTYLYPRQSRSICFTIILRFFL